MGRIVGKVTPFDSRYSGGVGVHMITSIHACNVFIIAMKVICHLFYMVNMSSIFFLQISGREVFQFRPELVADDGDDEEESFDITQYRRDEVMHIEIVFEIFPFSICC